MSKIYATDTAIIDDRNHVDRPAHLPRTFACENSYALMGLIDDLVERAEDWEGEYDDVKKTALDEIREITGHMEKIDEAMARLYTLLEG